MAHLLLLLQLFVVAPPTPVEWLQEETLTINDLVQGEDVTVTLQFRNTTDVPLVVENVRVGCGCTATDWQDVPVAPGAVGSINVTYDATNVGYFRKYVKVFFRGHRGGHKRWIEGFVE